MHHATLLSVWGRLRAFCAQAGDIGEAPEAHHLPLPAVYLVEALRAWAKGMTAPETSPALSHAALSYLLEVLGLVAGERLEH